MLRALLGALMVWRGGASMAARIAALLDLRSALKKRLPLAGIVDGKPFDGASSLPRLQSFKLFASAWSLGRLGMPAKLPSIAYDHPGLSSAPAATPAP